MLGVDVVRVKERSTLMWELSTGKESPSRDSLNESSGMVWSCGCFGWYFSIVGVEIIGNLSICVQCVLMKR